MVNRTISGRIFMATALVLFTMIMLGGKALAGSQAGNSALLANDSDMAASVQHFSITGQGVPSSTRNPAGSYSATTPNVISFLDASNRLNVCYFQDGKLIIQRFQTATMEKLGQIEIIARYAKFGNVTCDASGNYYVVWAQNDSSAENIVTMSIAKYNSEGTFQQALDIPGFESTPAFGEDGGTKNPFNSGNCDLAIQNGILAVNYGRQMYNGHQSNMIIYVNLSTMTRVSYNTVYTSHSFDQRIYAASDGISFLALNQGDAYNRCFSVAKISTSSQAGYGKLENFHFREGATRSYGYNETFAQMGGLAETQSAYVFAGSSERILSLAEAPSTIYMGHNDARDLFLQFLKKNYTQYSGANCYAVAGETRAAEGQVPTNPSTNLFLDGDEVDYGVLWLTNYDEDHYVAHPKVVSIGDDKVAVLWEKRAYSGTDVSAYFAILDSNGNVVRDTALMMDTMLAADTDPVYFNGKIYWATNDTYGFRWNVLDPNAALIPSHEHHFVENSRTGNVVQLRCDICGFTREIVTASSISYYLKPNGGGYLWSSVYESSGLAVASGEKVSLLIKPESGSTDVIETKISDGRLACFADGSTTTTELNPVIIAKRGGKVQVTITPLYVSNPVTRKFYLNITKGEGPEYDDGYITTEFGHTCDFQNKIELIYKVTAQLDGYDEYWLAIERQSFQGAGEEFVWETAEIHESHKDDDGRYVFAFNDIAAAEMGEIIHAKVVAKKGDKIYESDVDEYSLKTYAENRIRNSDDPKFRKLMVDMLNYGASAQVYFKKNTNHLVNAGLTEDERKQGTQEEITPVSVENVSENVAETARIVSKSVAFNSGVELNAYVNYDAEPEEDEKVWVELTYVATSGLSKRQVVTRDKFVRSVKDGVVRYCAAFNIIATPDFGKEVTLKVFRTVETDGVSTDAQISETYTYSLETYAANRLKNSKDDNFKALLRAMLKYERSALAFFSKPSE